MQEPVDKVASHVRINRVSFALVSWAHGDGYIFDSSYSY